MFNKSNFIVREDDLRKDFKARRTKQIQFIRDHPDVDPTILGKMMIEAKIYAPNVSIELAAARIVWERENPTTIGRKRREPHISVEEYARSIEHQQQEQKRESSPEDVEKARRAALRRISTFLRRCGWVRSRNRELWIDPIGRDRHRTDAAFLIANCRDLDLARFRKDNRP